VVVAVGETTSVPLVASAPVQPPLAVHDVAFVLDHVNVEVAPEAMLVGFAVSVTVGGADELTVTVAEAGADVPPVPLQVSVYVVVAVGETPSVPLVASAPVQPPEAVHEVAFVLDQVSVELAPEAIVVGFAVKVTVGAAIPVTVTVAEDALLPPVPVQVSV
jgi:hypothetical protein